MRPPLAGREITFSATHSKTNSPPVMIIELCCQECFFSVLYNNVWINELPNTVTFQSTEASSPTCSNKVQIAGAIPFLSVSQHGRIKRSNNRKWRLFKWTFQSPNFMVELKLNDKVMTPRKLKMLETIIGCSNYPTGKTHDILLQHNTGRLIIDYIKPCTTAWLANAHLVFNVQTWVLCLQTEMDLAVFPLHKT